MEEKLKIHKFNLNFKIGVILQKLLFFLKKTKKSSVSRI